MYCINCGAKLSDGQAICPICETKVYHPDIIINEDNTYPKIPFESEEINRNAFMFVTTMLFLIPLIVPILLELIWTDFSDVSWSGYASGGTLIFYTAFVMPYWFKKPNPVIFTSATSVLSIALLWFINYKTGGNWFYSFAFPVAGILSIITIATVTLSYYIRKGYLYIYGGSFIAIGAWTVLLEYDINTTFGISLPVRWSVAPLAIFFIIGVTLIVIATVKPFRESLRRKFFVGKVEI